MANNFIPVRLEYSGGSTPTGWAEYQTGETAVLPGNLNFSGNGRRITGDMGSGAGSFANRLFVQGTVGVQTRLSIMPPTGGVSSGIQMWANSADLENSSRCNVGIDSSGCFVSSDQTGTGSYTPLLFIVGGAEAARIAIDRSVVLGTSNSDPVTSQVAGLSYGNGFGLRICATQVSGCMHISRGATTGAGALLSFYYGNAAAGSISTNGSTVSYNTSSDYRLKDDVQPLDPVAATDRIMAYEPVTWTWKTDGSYGKGFIAHKNQAVDPATATGTKDEVEQIGSIVLADGTIVAQGVREPEDVFTYGEGAVWQMTTERPVYQGRDDSKMIPDMVSMLQRQEARIAELETQLQQVLALLQPA